MTNAQLFTAAHKLTKEVILKDDSYSATFGICIKMIKNGEITIVNEPKKRSTKGMSNAEICLMYAVEKLENGELNSYEEEFIESIQDYSKKELRMLSSKQYAFLNKIADEYFF